MSETRPKPSGNATTTAALRGEAGPERPVRAGRVIKSRGTVTVDVEHCKGCELCIPACPPAVLTMSTPVNHMGYRYPELHPGCTGCAACLLVCPDFVFEVFRFNQPQVHEVPMTGAGE